MRAYLIDPVARRLSVIQLPSPDGNTSQLKALHDIIGCNIVTAVSFDESHSVYIDDEGLLRRHLYSPLFAIKGYSAPLAGRGVLVDTDPRGQDDEPSISLETARCSLAFVDPISRGRFIARPATNPSDIIEFRSIRALVADLDAEAPTMFKPTPVSCLADRGLRPAPLPTAHINDKRYVIDFRLNEARLVSNPDITLSLDDIDPEYFDDVGPLQQPSPQETPMADADRKAGMTVFRNPKKKPDNNFPSFTGKLRLPDAVGEQAVSLWAHKTKHGKPMFTGKVAPNAADQINEMITENKPPNLDEMAAASQADLMVVAQRGGEGLKLNKHDIMLFSNPSKASDKPNRPDFWGYYNDGANRQFNVALWTNTDRNGNVYMKGSLELEDEPEKEQDADLEEAR